MAAITEVLGTKAEKALLNDFNKVSKDIAEKDEAYRQLVDNLTEKSKGGTNEDQKSPEFRQMGMLREQLDAVRGLRSDILAKMEMNQKLRALGTTKANAIAQEDKERRIKHTDASRKLFNNWMSTEKVSFNALSAEERDEFVTGDGFPLRPESVYRSDSGDGADLVETEINRRAIERMKLTGPCYELFQKFRVSQSDFEVGMADNTDAQSGFPGASNSMIDETYPAWATAEITWNLAHKAWFGDLENVVWTRWTERSQRRTFIPGPGGHMGLLERAMKRRVNDLLTNSTADGSSKSRTQVVGLHTAAVTTLLNANNAITIPELVNNLYAVPRPYRTMSEDDITLVDQMMSNVELQNGVVGRPSSLAWMMSDGLHKYLTNIAATQAYNNALPWYLDFDGMEPKDPNARMRFFSYPVYINGSLSDLASSDTAGSNLDKLVCVFGRFGYMAVREIDMFLREYGADSGAATFGTYKLSHVGISCKAWDCNTLSVGPTAGKCEAIQALGLKKA